MFYRDGAVRNGIEQSEYGRDGKRERKLDQNEIRMKRTSAMILHSKITFEQKNVRRSF